MTFRMEWGGEEGECSCPLYLPITNPIGGEETSLKVDTTGRSQQQKEVFFKHSNSAANKTQLSQ